MKKNDYLERATNINENCFVSPALIIVRKNKTVKIAPDSRKLNEISVERKAKMPNLEEELTSRISKKCRRRNRPNLDSIKTQSGLCKWATTVIKTRNGPMHIRNNWR